jgi:hypothetical protein
MLKLLMTWDIQPGKESAHFDFIARTFVPRMIKLGVQPTDLWSTVYGDAPQIVIGWVAADRPSINKMLHTAEYRSLREQLDEFVTDFKVKIVPADGPFSL